MNKPYLLIAGYNYYPDQGTGDWQGRYETHEEALAQVQIETNAYGSKVVMIGHSAYDWYEIVNLETWGMGNEETN